MLVSEKNLGSTDYFSHPEKTVRVIPLSALQYYDLSQ